MSDENISARKAAIEAIEAVLSRGRKPKDLVQELSAALEKRDRALLMELVYGVLRYRDTLDWILDRFLEKPGRLGGFTRNNLRVAVYQVYFMRTPEWAAVNEAVKMERRHRRLVNAVLRGAVRKYGALDGELESMRKGVADNSLDDGLRAGNIARLTSHPLWLVKRWVGRFGVEEAYRMARANNRIPQLVLRVNTLRADRREVMEKLRAMGIKAEPAAHSPVGITLLGRHSFDELEPLRGLFVAQDEAAQMVTLMLSPGPGERVLDACAAPGGKTTHIAQMMDDSGEVIALDINDARLAMLRDNIERLGLKSIKVINEDLREFRSDGYFDRVLVDAPCTSFGVIRRNPDVKYRHGKADLSRYKSRQVALLRSAAPMVRPGGTLLYCTCSTEPEEGEEVVTEFLKSYGEFFIIKDIPSVKEFLEGGFLRTYPHRHGMDGFFAVALGKTG